MALWYFQRFDFLSAIAAPVRLGYDRADGQLRLRRGETVRYTDTDHVFVVRSGKVHIADVSRSGRLMTSALLRPGDVFGLVDVPECDGPESVAEAWDTSTLLAIPYESFMTVVNQTPALRARLVLDMNGRHLRVAGRVGDFGQLVAASDAARQLLR